MLVKLRRTFIWQGVRFRKTDDGVEVPDDAAPELPSDALVWEDGEWMPVVEEDEHGHPVLDEEGQKIRRELDLPAPRQPKRPVTKRAQAAAKNAEKGPVKPPKPPESTLFGSTSKEPGRPASQPQGIKT